MELPNLEDQSYWESVSLKVLTHLLNNQSNEKLQINQQQNTSKFIKILKSIGSRIKNFFVFSGSTAFSFIEMVLRGLVCYCHSFLEVRGIIKLINFISRNVINEEKYNRRRKKLQDNFDKTLIAFLMSSTNILSSVFLPSKWNDKLNSKLVQSMKKYKIGVTLIEAIENTPLILNLLKGFNIWVVPLLHLPFKVGIVGKIVECSLGALITAGKAIRGWYQKVVRYIADNNLNISIFSLLSTGYDTYSIGNDISNAINLSNML